MGIRAVTEGPYIRFAKELSSRFWTRSLAGRIDQPLTLFAFYGQRVPCIPTHDTKGERPRD